MYISEKKRLLPCALIVPVLLLLCFASCSLNYMQEPEDDGSIPEFVFSSAVLNRIERGRLTLRLESVNLEQYKNDNSFFGSGIHFAGYDETGKKETSGTSGFLYGNQKTKIYVLLDGVLLDNFTENIAISAKNLRWNSEHERLSAGTDDLVTIQRFPAAADSPAASNTEQDLEISMEISGYDFAAEGVSLDYRFGRAVSGWFVPDDAGTENGGAE